MRFRGQAISWPLQQRVDFVDTPAHHTHTHAHPDRPGTSRTTGRRGGGAASQICLSPLARAIGVSRRCAPVVRLTLLPVEDERTFWQRAVQRSAADPWSMCVYVCVCMCMCVWTSLRGPKHVSPPQTAPQTRGGGNASDGSLWGNRCLLFFIQNFVLSVIRAVVRS